MIRTGGLEQSQAQFVDTLDAEIRPGEEHDVRAPLNLVKLNMIDGDIEI